jgi:hypothetical protein
VRTSEQPNPGFELDWLAVDAYDHVAIFSAAGHGPIPRIVAQHLGDVEKAIERLPSLPILGECSERPTGDDDYSFWVEPARRGIFGYDWGGTHVPPYARVTAPSRPVTSREIADAVVRNAASLVRLPIDFRSTRALDDKQLEEFGLDLFSG